MGNANSEIDANKAKLALDYAWNYFDFHARQRTLMFNFFIISAGILASAVGFLLRGDYDGIVSVPLFAGSILSLAFLALDIRNTQLLQLAEGLLETIEEEYVFKDFPPVAGRNGSSVQAGLIAREANWERDLRAERKRLPRYEGAWHYVRYNRVKHKMAIRVVQSMAFFLFAATAVFSLPMDLFGEIHIGFRYSLQVVLLAVMLLLWLFILSVAGKEVGTRL